MARYYSRLKSIQERRKARKAFMLLLLTVGIIILAVVVGFKFLSQFFLFINTLNPNNRTNLAEDYIPPGPPKIYIPFEATNSAKIKISGSAEPGSIVYMTRNSNPVGDVVTGDDGEFVFTNVSLDEGQNSFSAVAVDAAGNRSQPSGAENVQLLNKKPELDLTEPKDGQKIQGGDAYVEIKGKTDPNVRLTVNDRVVIVYGSGSFNYRVSLADGDNKIVITATDQAGNSNIKSLTVKYSPE